MSMGSSIGNFISFFMYLHRGNEPQEYYGLAGKIHEILTSAKSAVKQHGQDASLNWKLIGKQINSATDKDVRQYSLDVEKTAKGELRFTLDGGIYAPENSISINFPVEVLPRDVDINDKRQLNKWRVKVWYRLIDSTPEKERHQRCSNFYFLGICNSASS